MVGGAAATATALGEFAALWRITNIINNKVLGNIACVGYLPYALAQLGVAYVLHGSDSTSQEFELEPAGMILATFPSRTQGLQ